MATAAPLGRIMWGWNLGVRSSSKSAPLTGFEHGSGLGRSSARPRGAFLLAVDTIRSSLRGVSDSLNLLVKSCGPHTQLLGGPSTLSLVLEGWEFCQPINFRIGVLSFAC